MRPDSRSVEKLIAELVRIICRLGHAYIALNFATDQVGLILDECLLNGWWFIM